tara:strand:- start:1860 stop:3173 length:1314 start_codon:yes stop_codon:yes gene_type:complete
MNEQILVPALGESITEATVSKWLKKPGEKVIADDPVVELETDKVNLEVPSPVDGVFTEQKVKEGDTVKVGAVLGIITKGGDKSDNETPIVKNLESLKETEQKVSSIKEEVDEIGIINANHQEPEDPTEEEPLILNDEVLVLNNKEKEQELNKNKILSPAVRKIVTEKKINTNEITGSGKDGRIIKGDLINLMGTNPKPSERKIKYGPEERFKMTRLRQTIAKRLKEAQENAAMLTTFNEVDMTNIISMRKDNQDDFQSRFGVKLGFMSFFVKACIVALKSFPAINAEVEGQEIIYKNYYNISFAVGTERGLVVPVLKKADELSFAEIEKNIKIISEKARNSNLTIEDLQGGTFTISNGGVYGSMLSTPILNPPQSAVLGMHNIVERAIIIDKQIKIRPIMYLALSYDHRIIDGKDSVSFLKMVKENLEDPRRLFLDV